MKRISRSAIVEHSAAELYALVANVEAYPQFLPWCLEARVHDQTPTATQATLTAGMGRLRQSFTTRNDNRPGHSIEMQLVEGPFRSFSASWRFAALSENACRIDFSLEYEFASRTVARLLEPLFDRIADTMVDAFARRADQIYGANKR